MIDEDGIPPNPFNAILGLQNEFVEAGDRAALRFAQKLAGRVRRKIGAQEDADELPPLTPKYLERKISLGLNEGLLQATEEYRNSIQARKTAEGMYEVAPADRPHENTILSKSPATLRQIGLWLEYGTRNMPPRPHWRIVMEELNANPDEAIAIFGEEFWAEVSPRIEEEIRKLRE